MNHSLPDPANKNSFNLALSLFFTIGFMVAIPTLLFGIGGVYVDHKFHTEPTFTFTGFFLALAVAGYAVYKSVRAILQAEEEEAKDEANF